MKILGSQLIWYTFLAITTYLILTRWKGANALLGTGAAGYVRIVKTLQGR